MTVKISHSGHRKISTKLLDRKMEEFKMRKHLFSTGDWLCPKCSKHNRKNTIQCKRCKRIDKRKTGK